MNLVPLLFIAFTLCIAAGITAGILNRFRKKTASLFALAAGFSPSLFFMAYQGVMDSQYLVFAGMFGAAPLFLIAFFAYGFGSTTKQDKLAAAASMIGFFLGGGYSLILIALLSRAE